LRDYYAQLAHYGLLAIANRLNVISAGLYFHEVAPGLCCGTQPRNPAELEQLAKGHGINVIVNLQQDKDMQYWGVDFEANQRKCQELGLRLIRKPVSRPLAALLYCCVSGYGSRAADVRTLTYTCCWSMISAKHSALWCFLQAIDFDPHSLRKTLPTAVKEVALAMQDGKRCEVYLPGTAYAIHSNLTTAPAADCIILQS
jgi:hypothetical protein